MAQRAHLVQELLAAFRIMKTDLEQVLHVVLRAAAASGNALDGPAEPLQRADEVVFVAFDASSEASLGTLTTNPAGNGHVFLRDAFPQGTRAAGNVVVRKAVEDIRTAVREGEPMARPMAETGLFDGTRVSKADVRVEAYGAVDETNALLGVAAANTTDAELREILRDLQRDLFAVGAQLADPKGGVRSRKEKTRLTEARVAELEALIDRVEADLPPLKRFILPGGSPAGAALHLARTVCRRAERHIVALTATVALPPLLLAYINRLSDLLFVLARLAKADCLGRAPGVFNCDAMDWFLERARRLGVEHRAPAPILLGRHLLELGMKPGPRIGEILKAVYERQLDGAVTNLDEALAEAKQIL